jgi:hypothetical protein
MTALRLFFLLSDGDLLWVSSNENELKLPWVQCVATYEVDDVDINDCPARAVVMKLLESYTRHSGNTDPGMFPDGHHEMPGYHMAELLAVAFSLGARWAHDTPDHPSSHSLDVSA